MGAAPRLRPYDPLVHHNMVTPERQTLGDAGRRAAAEAHGPATSRVKPLE